MKLVVFVKVGVLRIENRESFALRKVGDVVDVLPLVWRPNILGRGIALKLQHTRLAHGRGTRITDAQCQVGERQHDCSNPPSAANAAFLSVHLRMIAASLRLASR